MKDWGAVPIGSPTTALAGASAGGLWLTGCDRQEAGTRVVLLSVTDGTLRAEKRWLNDRELSPGRKSWSLARGLVHLPFRADAVVLHDSGRVTSLPGLNVVDAYGVCVLAGSSNGPVIVRVTGEVPDRFPLQRVCPTVLLDDGYATLEDQVVRVHGLDHRVRRVERVPVGSALWRTDGRLTLSVPEDGRTRLIGRVDAELEGQVADLVASRSGYLAVCTVDEQEVLMMDSDGSQWSFPLEFDVRLEATAEGLLAVGRDRVMWGDPTPQTLQTPSDAQVTGAFWRGRPCLLMNGYLLGPQIPRDATWFGVRSSRVERTTVRSPTGLHLAGIDRPYGARIPSAGALGEGARVHATLVEGSLGQVMVAWSSGEDSWALDGASSVLPSGTAVRTGAS